MKLREAAWLLLILSGALLMRIPALRWGLPPPIPHVVASDIRCSYAFDEDDVLTYVSFTKPSELDLDFRLYHWGTLHFSLVLPWLAAAENLGYIGGEWRMAYYNMLPGSFERVYAAGRLLSTVTALAAVVFLFLAGREMRDPQTGLWAAALMATSPAHLLTSVQIRVDSTMLACMTLTLWLALIALRSGRLSLNLCLGLAAALSVTAKYPAFCVVIPLVVAALASRRFPFPAVGAVTMGFCAGVLIGQPYVLVRGSEMFHQLYQVFMTTSEVEERFRLSLAKLLATHAMHATRFLLGPVAMILSVMGLCGMARRRAAKDWVMVAGFTGAALSLIPLAWPLLRYELPLLPFLALAAASPLRAFKARRCWAAGGLALAFPLGASLAQLAYMRSPHPANQVLRLILERVPPGTPISRLVAELPPLDRKTYPMGPNPFLDDLTRDPPEWVLATDLPDRDYPAQNLDLLRKRYDKIGEFRADRILGWASFGERGAPHDWKYTHPRMTLYHRRSR